MTTISLVMIVKNEEKILEKCIASVAPIIDEYIIVDTGSSDSTKELIQKYGELHEIPFTNFVDTKNKALKLATSDYILFMDADETIIAGLEYLKEHAESGTDCVYAKVVEGKDNHIYNTYLRARLWKNNGKWKFEGPYVHEVIVGEGNSISDYRVEVLHDHSHRDAASYPARFENYVKLLSKYLSEHPKDSRATYYLGRTQQDLGHVQEAIYHYKQYLSYNTTFRDERWDAAYNIAKCWKSQGEYTKTISACDLALSIDNRRAEIYTLLGQVYYELQDTDKAIEAFEKAVKCPIPTDVVLFLNPKNYFELPADYLVLLYNKKKDYRKAVEYARKLAEMQKKPDARLLNNLTFLQKEQNKTIFFCLGNTPEEVYGSIIEDKGVGGVETTYVELPIEMTNRGHTCFVFCNCKEEHVYKNTYFVPYENISKYADLNPDIIITSRWFEPLYMFPDTKKIIWAQDAHFSDPKNPDAYDIMDKLVCSSLWHRQYIAERFGERIPAEKIAVIPLSIRKELFANQKIKRKPNKVIYSSNPDRGLYILKDMWKEISERVPGIELVITYGWEGLETWSDSSEWLAKIHSDKKSITDWANEAGNVTLTGRLTKANLAKEMLSSSLCLYPNNFWESFCLTALETQAAGTPMITTNLGALSTTLNHKSNILIDEFQYSNEYKRIFIDNAVELLSNKQKLKQYSKDCISYVDEYPNWAKVAEQWENAIYCM